MNEAEDLHALESELRQLKRAPLPDSWKDELIDQAQRHARPPGVSTLALLSRAGLACIACCWLLIGFFAVTQPEEESNPAISGLEDLSSQEISLAAARLLQRTDLLF